MLALRVLAIPVAASALHAQDSGHRAQELPAAAGNTYEEEAYQSGLWFGPTDDLWHMGTPTGWADPWWNTPASAGDASDPFLMIRFDQNVVHLQDDHTEPVTFTVEAGLLGKASRALHETISVEPLGYSFHTFPQGFNEHRVRIHIDSDRTATACFAYS